MTTDKPKPHREWWIPACVGGFYDGQECMFAVGPRVDGELPNPGGVLVVEVSALREAEREIAILKANAINLTAHALEQSEIISELAAALEYFAADGTDYQVAVDALASLAKHRGEG